MFAAPATTAVASPPAVDQYTTHLPGAGGNSGLASSSAPVAQPGQLPGPVRAALAGRDGQLLTLIATAPGLGAPAVNERAGGGASGGGGSPTPVAARAPPVPSPALTTAVADAVGSAPSPRAPGCARRDRNRCGRGPVGPPSPILSLMLKATAAVLVAAAGLWLGAPATPNAAASTGAVAPGRPRRAI